MSAVRKNIAIIAGGYSSEYAISLESAKEVMGALNPDKYASTLVKISQEGWQAVTEDGTYPINKNDFSYQMNGSPVYFDGVFNSIHGTPGENGIMQAYFELVEIPITGCDSFCSSLTFNKFACNNMLKSLGITVAKSMVIRKGERIDAEKIMNVVGLPCFVKPNSGGSSCGISRVNHKKDLVKAIETALEEDEEVIIEAFLKGSELTCGLVKTAGELLIFPLTEIVSKKEFFDYEAKYTPGVADEITPARIPDEIRDECQALSGRIYEILNCKGLVRMDYILSDGKLWFLEVNTVPGMTPQSIVPQQIRAMGMDPADVYALIMDDILSG